MAQRAIERGVGLDRVAQSRVDVSQAVAAFIAKNGVRRFEQGESGSYEAIQSFLAERGYDLKFYSNKYWFKQIGSRGAGKRMAWSQVLDFVDQLRASEGRPTVKRRAA
ncbi:hypothetical protein [Ensifer aridi]|uniref:hypothetical protein n=1 Tax=Ensifer aridi TaxID=1708715 RepID=UPI001FCE23EE|nr:hypothetical protein [Ensifer aridi]